VRDRGKKEERALSAVRTARVQADSHRQLPRSRAQDTLELLRQLRNAKNASSRESTHQNNVVLLWGWNSRGGDVAISDCFNLKDTAREWVGKVARPKLERRLLALHVP
jgi:hypothetical protein